MSIPVEALEEKMGYRFGNQALLLRALTHRSWFFEHTSPESGDNEQLEFLGDSILGFIVSESLVAKYPSAHEGQLSQWKAHLVSSSHLHGCAVDLGLGAHLRLGKGEERSGGRERKTVLANALEAVIAAVHLDGGIEAGRAFIHKHVLGALEDSQGMPSARIRNFKNLVQERTQALHLPLPRYLTVGTTGPEHAKTFTIEARIGARFISRAHGTSKKLASERAAELLLEQLNTAEPELARTIPAQADASKAH